MGPVAAEGDWTNATLGKELQRDSSARRRPKGAKGARQEGRQGGKDDYLTGGSLREGASGRRPKAAEARLAPKGKGTRKTGYGPHAANQCMIEGGRRCSRQAVRPDVQ